MGMFGSLLILLFSIFLRIDVKVKVGMHYFTSRRLMEPSPQLHPAAIINPMGVWLAVSSSLTATERTPTVVVLTLSGLLLYSRIFLRRLLYCFIQGLIKLCGQNSFCER